MYRPRRNPNQPSRPTNPVQQNGDINPNNFYSTPTQPDQQKHSQYAPMNQITQHGQNGGNHAQDSVYQLQQNSSQQDFYNQYAPTSTNQPMQVQSTTRSSFTSSTATDQFQSSQSSQFYNGFHPDPAQNQLSSQHSYSSGFDNQYAVNTNSSVQSRMDNQYRNVSAAAQPVPPQPMTFMQDSSIQPQQTMMPPNFAPGQSVPSMQQVPTSNPQMNPQTQMPPQQQWQSPQPFMNAMAGVMLGGAQGGTAGVNSAIGAQIFQTLAPGAVGYTSQLVGSFMQMPKYYFTVNHRYVLKKLSIILFPFVNRTWARQRAMDAGHYDGSNQNTITYLPPRDDVNAPDLYIPVMAFLTYVLMVGLTYGIHNRFKVGVMASFFSGGFAVLVVEVLVIKLGLTLINARPTPWLDVIAYRGYKFVGVSITMLIGLIVPKLCIPALIYFASAMGLFLMRSHRRIILPRDMDPRQAEDLARRNLFLLFLSVLQYPIYFVLVPYMLSRPGSI